MGFTPTNRAFWRGLLFWAMLAGPAPMTAAQTVAPSAVVNATPSPPVEHFVRPPAIDDVRVSPSGKHLAAILAHVDGKQVLGVISLDPLGEPRTVAAFADVDIVNARWVNDNRLVFHFVNRAAPADRRRTIGLYAVDRDGKNLRELIASQPAADFDSTASRIPNRVLSWEWSLHSALDDDSADVLVSRGEYDADGLLRGRTLARLDTLTGRSASISQGLQSHAVDFIVDRRGNLRAYATSRGGRTNWYWRENPDVNYQQIAEFETYGGAGWQALALDEHGRLLVVARQQRDTTALHVFDPRQRVLIPEPVIAVNGFDLDPMLEFDRQSQRLLGLHLYTDRPLSHWVEPQLARLQASVDAALPAGRHNGLHCGRSCVDSRFVVISSDSDREPGAYLLLDRQSMSMQPIARVRPWISEASQARRSFHRVPARDGLQLPVYLTRPQGASGRLPTVVLVHGGPFMRGHDLHWNAHAAFLASRGYLVIETEFRGSAGYGWRHFSAGWRQWGLLMQDDLADALAWAVREGHADAGRACIMGGSYGGYAALMGAVRQGELFRCAVSFAGVTDIGLMYDINWSDFGNEWRYYGMPKLVGDPKADAVQFERTSPLRRAAEIRMPILVAHGLLDQRVPIDHFNKFEAAAKAAKVPIETMVFSDQPHGFPNPARHADFLRRVETFLARSLQAR